MPGAFTVGRLTLVAGTCSSRLPCRGQGPNLWAKSRQVKRGPHWADMSEVGAVDETVVRGSAVGPWRSIGRTRGARVLLGYKAQRAGRTLISRLEDVQLVRAAGPFPACPKQSPFPEQTPSRQQSAP